MTTLEEETEWFAKNVAAFPDAWYPDDDEFSSDLISLVVTDDVPVEVHTSLIPICSMETPELMISSMLNMSSGKANASAAAG
jgi:hypothetical protein